MLLRAIDTSSHQPADLTELITRFGPGLVIVKLYQQIERITPQGNSRMAQAHSRAQIASALAAGVEVSGYMWLYADYAYVEDAVDQAIDLAISSGLALPFLAIDVETYVDGSIPDAHMIARAISQCVKRGVEPVIYWSREMWKRAGSPTDEVFNVYQWVAEYVDWIPEDLYDVTPVVGPYHLVVGHQYTSDPLDLSIFDAFWHEYSERTLVNLIEQAVQGIHAERFRRGSMRKKVVSSYLVDLETYLALLKEKL